MSVIVSSFLSWDMKSKNRLTVSFKHILWLTRLSLHFAVPCHNLELEMSSMVHYVESTGVYILLVLVAISKISASSTDFFSLCPGKTAGNSVLNSINMKTKWVWVDSILMQVIMILAFEHLGEIEMWNMIVSCLALSPINWMF